MMFQNAYEATMKLLGVKGKICPLLILGKRQSGKSTTLREVARLSNATIISPTKMQAQHNFPDAKSIWASVKMKPKDEDKNGLYCVDEFHYCEHLPKKGRIIALTDDVNNFKEVGQRLKKMGYFVQ